VGKGLKLREKRRRSRASRIRGHPKEGRKNCRKKNENWEKLLKKVVRIFFGRKVNILNIFLNEHPGTSLAPGIQDLLYATGLGQNLLIVKTSLHPFIWPSTERIPH